MEPISRRDHVTENKLTLAVERWPRASKFPANKREHARVRLTPQFSRKHTTIAAEHFESLMRR
jgi:hypothetical protein